MWNVFSCYCYRTASRENMMEKNAPMLCTDRINYFIKLVIHSLKL